MASNRRPPSLPPPPVAVAKPRRAARPPVTSSKPAASDQSAVYHRLDERAQVERREYPSAGLERVREVRGGLPYAELEQLQAVLALSASETAHVLGIPERTLARRKHDRKLTPEESDRLDRITRIVELGKSVLGDEAKMRAWLHAVNRSLGGVVPLDLLDTDRGVRAVEDVLLRIEHGTYG